MNCCEYSKVFFVPSSIVNFGNFLKERVSPSSKAKAVKINSKRNLGASSVGPEMSRVLAPDVEPDEFGWFEDFEHGAIEHSESPSKVLTTETDKKSKRLHRVLTLPTPLTEPPVYVLESSLSYQELWYVTAGRRPKQPLNERAHYELLWKENFLKSRAQYLNSENAIHFPNQDDDTGCLVIFKGKGPHSNAVSRAFPNFPCSNVMLQLPHFRILQDKSGRQHAEFLILVVLGNLKFGIWKRYSDFKKLSETIQEIQNKSSLTDIFVKTMLSWNCVTVRQRWFRCLDKEYLAIKCYLLERFIHDMLFESSTPDTLMKFLGLLEFSHKSSVIGDSREL